MTLCYVCDTEPIETSEGAKTFNVVFIRPYGLRCVILEEDIFFFGLNSVTGIIANNK